MATEQIEFSATNNSFGQKRQWKEFEAVKADLLEKIPLDECALFGFFLLLLKYSMKKCSELSEYSVYS